MIPLHFLSKLKLAWRLHLMVVQAVPWCHGPYQRGHALGSIRRSSIRGQGFLACAFGRGQSNAKLAGLNCTASARGRAPRPAPFAIYGQSAVTKPWSAKKRVSLAEINFLLLSSSYLRQSLARVLSQYQSQLA